LVDDEAPPGRLDVEVTPGVPGRDGPDARAHVVIGDDLEDLGVLVGERQSVRLHRRALVVKRGETGGLALAPILAPVVGEAGGKCVNVPAVIGRRCASEQCSVGVLLARWARRKGSCRGSSRGISRPLRRAPTTSSCSTPVSTSTEPWSRSA